LNSFPESAACLIQLILLILWLSYIWHKVQAMKFPISRISAISCRFLHLRSKYPPHHLFSKVPSLCSLTTRNRAWFCTEPSKYTSCYLFSSSYISCTLCPLAEMYSHSQSYVQGTYLSLSYHPSYTVTSSNHSCPLYITGSRSVLHGNQWIRERSPGNPCIQFCNAYFKVWCFVKIIVELL
jgi:hypothetical protein